nr:hypothetical protein [Candidatus Njordarchaeota archaeon]
MTRFGAIEVGFPFTDIEISLTLHAMQRLNERFGVTLRELGKLRNNYFDFESFSASGKTHWRMIVPLRFCFIGTFEGNCFVVKTVFFNLSQSIRKQIGKFRRLRITNIMCRPAERQTPSLDESRRTVPGHLGGGFPVR